MISPDEGDGDVLLKDDDGEHDNEELDDGHQLQDVQVAAGEGLTGKQPSGETLAS